VQTAAVDIAAGRSSLVVRTIVTEALRIGERGAHVVPHVVGALSPG